VRDPEQAAEQKHVRRPDEPGQDHDQAVACPAGERRPARAHPVGHAPAADADGERGHCVRGEEPAHDANAVRERERRDECEHPGGGESAHGQYDQRAGAGPGGAGLRLDR